MQEVLQIILSRLYVSESVGCHSTYIVGILLCCSESLKEHVFEDYNELSIILLS